MGKHLILEVYHVNYDLLNDGQKILEIATAGIIRAGMTILNSYLHQFKPQGITIVIALSESHFSLHSWPEKGCVSFDIHTCGDKNPRIIAIEMLKYLNSKNYSIREITR